MCIIFIPQLGARGQQPKKKKKLMNTPTAQERVRVLQKRRREKETHAGLVTYIHDGCCR